MLECLYPKVYLDSTYEIDFEQYYQDGYRAIIFDIEIRWCHMERPPTSGLLPYLRDCTLSDIRP